MGDPNYGLLGGMASGIKEGLVAYQTTQNIQRQNQMQNLLSGVQKDGDGNLQFTPEMQQQRQLQNQATQSQAKEFDPNSEESQGARAYAKSTTGQDLPDTVTAHQIKEYSPYGVGMLKNQGLIGSAQVKADASTDNAQTSADAKAGAAAAGSDRHAASSQDKVFHDVQSMVESARGNKSVQQAESDLYAAKKFESLTNLYGDPNKLNPQQVQLAASEIGKIAQGGSPTESELKGLNQDTIPKTLASAAQYFTNSPSAANQGKFIQAMQDYTTALRGDAQGIVSERYGRIIESNKNGMGPDHYQDMQKQYINRFNPSGQNAPAQGSGQGLLGSQAQGQQSAQAPHAQDSAAVQWAKSNPNDPRSAAIMKANGL